MLDEASNAVGDMLKEIDPPSLSMIRNHQDWGTLSTNEGRYDLPAFIRLLMQIRNERGGQGSELAAAMSVLNSCCQHPDENISAYEQRYAEALRQAEDAGYAPPVDVVACVGHFTNRLREADKRKVETYVNAVGQGSMPPDASFRAISRYISSNMGLTTALGLSPPPDPGKTERRSGGWLVGRVPEPGRRHRGAR